MPAGVGKSLGSSEVAGFGGTGEAEAQPRLERSPMGERSSLAREETAGESLAAAASRAARRGRLDSEFAVAVPIDRDEVTPL